MDELKVILKEAFGKKCNVDEILENYLAEEQKPEAENSDEKDAGMLFNRKMDEVHAFRCEEREKFDIVDMEDLEGFEEGDTLEPRLERAVKESFTFYNGATEEADFIELMNGDHYGRCQFLVNNNQRLLLRESDWLHIFDKLEKDKSSYKRYYPMVRVIANGDLQNMVRAFVLNDEFYNYCNILIKEVAEEAQRGEV